MLPLERGDLGWNDPGDRPDRRRARRAEGRPAARVWPGRPCSARWGGSRRHVRGRRVAGRYWERTLTYVIRTRLAHSCSSACFRRPRLVAYSRATSGVPGRPSTVPAAVLLTRPRAASIWRPVAGPTAFDPRAAAMAGRFRCASGGVVNGPSAGTSLVLYFTITVTYFSAGQATRPSSLALSLANSSARSARVKVH